MSLECAQILDDLGLFKHECNCLMIRKVYPQNEEEKNGRYFPSEIEFVEALSKEHFLLRVFERSEITHTYVPSPTSKHKFIQIQLTEKNIRFIDFMRFIPVSKGDFPHRFNNGQNDNYVGSIPAQKDKTKFIQWHSEQQQIYCSCASGEGCTVYWM